MTRVFGVVDALDNLGALCDARSLAEVEVTEEGFFVLHREEEEPSYFMEAGVDEQTFDALAQTFHIVTDHLNHYSKKVGGDQARLAEGVSPIMVLVGEAIARMEQFGPLFKQKVLQMPEYQELQDFYSEHIVKDSFREFAKTPIAREEETEEVSAGVHILNDIDVIKKDHLYELFYMKNEANHTFYTYSLARNIKLACDFGHYAQEYFGDDPLLQIKNWEDKSLHLFASGLLKSCRKGVEHFYKQYAQFKQMELAECVNKALMALMLAANSRNMIRQFSVKGCHHYFHDFQLFLREALLSRDYQKLVLYTPSSEGPFLHHLIDLIHSLCYGLYTSGLACEELDQALLKIVHKQVPKRSEKLGELLEQAYHALEVALAAHPSGPIFKIVDLIREEEKPSFDPLLLGNVPTHEGVFEVAGKEVQLLRMASPTCQDYVHHAILDEEFRVYLDTLVHKKEKLLIFNLQDRTSWLEHARTHVLEEVSRQAGVAEALCVVTLTKETDFYHQSGVYADLDDAAEFCEQFALHLSDESTGYFFSQKLKEPIAIAVPALLAQVHKEQFGGRRKLSHEERLEFVEIAYAKLQFKVVELVAPDRIAFLSKDGLDLVGTAIVLFRALLGERGEDLVGTCFAQTLAHRERLVDKERFLRMVHAITRLEEAK